METIILHWFLKCVLKGQYASY